jgi:hypothetical protein
VDGAPEILAQKMHSGQRRWEWSDVGVAREEKISALDAINDVGRTRDRQQGQAESGRGGMGA